MSLADRKETAQKDEEKKNKISNGDYRVRLKDWKFGKSKGGGDMYTLTWKIRYGLNKKGKEEPTEEKGKDRRTYYPIGQNWAVIALLDFLEATGANLAAMEKMSECDDVFEEIEDNKMPMANMNLENVEGKQFPRIAITEVEKVLNLKGKPESKPAKTEEGKKEEDGEDEVATPD